MIELIRKRHPAASWVVMTEVGNATGYKVQRHADAVAFGIWPSHGLAIHGYELKVSRADVQKELKDPTKADAVGGYCDFWWLVISDLKIIDGLVIPESWGILHPKSQVLRVHRKAPKRKAKPFDRSFAAAMIRNVTKTWVPSSVHNALKEDMHQQVIAKAAEQRLDGSEDAKRELDRLKKRVAEFEEAAGFSIENYQAGRQGEAVRLLMDIRNSHGQVALERDIRVLEQTISQHERIASQAKHAADQLKTLVAPQGEEALNHHPSSTCDRLR